MGTRSALRRSRRRRRAPAGPSTGPAGHEPRVALLAGPGGGGSPDPADHRRNARRRRDRPRLAHGRRRLSAVHGRRPCAARLREDGRPRRPGLRAWRGPGAEPARSARPARRQPPFSGTPASAPSPANAVTPSRSPRILARWGNAQAPPLPGINLYLHLIHYGTNFRVLVQTQYLVPDVRLSRICRASGPVLRSFRLR